MLLLAKKIFTRVSLKPKEVLIYGLIGNYFYMNNKELLRAAIEIAELGGKHTLTYFKKNISISEKEDRTPVTIADKEAEAIMREAIANRFPGHGIVGEEFGKENESSDIQWILDPIDGTKTFIHEIPLYTTLLGVSVNGVPEVGIIYSPATNELCAAAIGEGATLNGEPCQVNEIKKLSEATLLTENYVNAEIQGYYEPFKKLIKKTKIHRTWGDGYGHLMVATGRAEIMLDPILDIWDAAALLPIIKESGGRYTDVKGVESIETGSGISTNGHLHKEVIDILNT